MGDIYDMGGVMAIAAGVAAGASRALERSYSSEFIANGCKCFKIINA